MKVKILHKIWTLLFVPRGGILTEKRATGTSKRGLDVADDGNCDPPDLKGKKIRIADNLEPKVELEVIIHECLHAADWYKDEEWVRIAAEDISRVLWRLGWRNPK